MTPLERFEREQLRKALEKKKKKSWYESASDLLGGSKDDAEREKDIRESAFKQKAIRETKNMDYEESARDKMIREANEAMEARRKKREEHEKYANSNNYEDGGVAKKSCKYKKLKNFLKK